MGCTDETYDNYNPNATIDDGSCYNLLTLNDIIHNCNADMGESLICDGEYDLSAVSAIECSLYENQVTTTGTIVDYFDITPFNGPHSFTIEDSEGYRVDFVIWPGSSTYQDGFDITETDLNLLTGNFGSYEVQITGELGAYCDDDELLDIFSEWQITVEYESDIIILDGNYGNDPDASAGVCFNEYGIYQDSFDYKENCLENDNYRWILTDKAKIIPAPYVIIPTIGEKLDYAYISPAGSRTIVRIFDLSGRFITTLVDRYDEQAKIILNDAESSSWDGRDEVGQIVSPGTYLMHLEAMNFATGETTTDVAPIVVGVKQ